MPPYRFGFIMQQVLGHVAAYRNFRHCAERDQTVLPSWTEVTFVQPGGWIERLPAVPPSLRGALRGVVQVQRGLGWSPLHGLVGAGTSRFDAVLFSTQALCPSVRGFMRQVPSIIVTDVTPSQYVTLGGFYGRSAARLPALAQYKHRVYVDVYRAARLIAPWSAWTRDSLIQDYGVPADKIVVVPPGVNVGRWAPPPAGSREASLGRQMPHVLFVGGDFARKGGPLLLDWFAARGRGRCELHVVTRTPPSLPAPLPGLHLHTNLEANDPRLMQLYRDSHVFVLPTLADCFGVASIEAMATGLPVITTRVGGVPEILEDGDEGFLIEPDDGRALASRLERLLGDATFRRAMGERARARVLARFDAQLLSARLLGLMKGLVAATPG